MGRTRPNLIEVRSARFFDQGFDRPEDVSRAVRGAMDLQADPCEDFYRYACGSWLDRAARVNRAVVALGLWGIDERNRIWLWQLLAKADAARGGPQARLATFYQACMNEPAIEQVGLAPLESLRRQIESVHDPATFFTAVAAMHRAGLPVLFAFGIVPDPDEPSRGAVSLDTAPVGLIVRNWYLTRDMEARRARDLYTEYIARMFALDGESKQFAAAAAPTILDFESRLAEILPGQQPRQRRSEPAPRFSPEAFEQLVTPLPFSAYFEAAGIEADPTVVLQSPEYFSALPRVLDGSDPAVLRLYLHWNLLRLTAPVLPAAFRDEHFEFYGRKLLGQMEPLEPWERCIQSTEESLGAAVAQVYLDDPVAAETVARAKVLLNEVRQAATARVGRAEWMDAETRRRAAEKIEQVTIHIGYSQGDGTAAEPALSPNAFLENVLWARRQHFDQSVQRVGKDIDRAAFRVAPFIAAAFYRPEFHDMLLPLGILQAPIFDRRLGAPMNFGALGSVVGHELFHALDAAGRRFDATAHPVDWWDAETARALDERVRCMDEHFGRYLAVPPRLLQHSHSREIQAAIPLDPQRTSNENLCDISGTAASFDAYRHHVMEHGEPTSLVDDLTNDQLFFVASAQVWCVKMHPVLEEALARADPHAPPRVRVNGALAQVPAFAEAFHCPVGSPMRPASTCSLW